jgi:ABC-2 type transport system permease protein
MLRAAIRGETLKLWRNQRLVWIAFWLPPIVLILIGIGLEALSPKEALAVEGLLVARPVRQVMSALQAAGNPIVQIFYGIGAASLIANEYRWETWRLTAPRNDRRALVLAKFLVFMRFGLTSFAILAVGAFALSLYAPLAYGAPIRWPPAGALLVEAAAPVLSALLQLTFLGAFCLFAAVLTRSLLGAVVPALIFSLVQLLATEFGPSGDGFDWRIVLPTFAASALRAPAEAGGSQNALLGGLSLCLWMAMLLYLAAAIFQRQDLAKE